MKIKIFYKITFIIYLFAMSSGALSARTWTSADGLKKFTGEYISHTDETVTVSKNKREITFQLNKLSQEDRDWLIELDELAEEKALALKNKKGKLESHIAENADIKSWHSYLPKSYSADGPKHPVCFIYEPWGKSKSILQKMIPTADELGWVLVGIDSYSNKRSAERKLDIIVEDCQIIRKLAFSELNIDIQKTVYGGLSGGGWWSYSSSSRLDKPAAGILSFGGWMSGEYHLKFPRKMAVAIVNGDKDKGARTWELKDMKFLEEKARADVKLFHFPGGHVMAPSDICLKAAKWIHETKQF